MQSFVRYAKSAKDTLTSSDMGSGVVENFSMSLKTTPSKSAQKTSQFALLCNHMLKRNESGVWQKRFVCIVPHLFLYYFDNDQSDSPRGIIDLEYFTNCTSDDENVLTLSPMEGIPLRSFYFQIDDPTVFLIASNVCCLFV